MQRKARQQQKLLSAQVRQAKENRADLYKTAPDKKKLRKPPDKKGGRRPSASLLTSLATKMFGRADAPQTVQQSIPYREMYRDGICRVNERLYTKTIRFFDINYLLAQPDDQRHIFENYCDWLNYFDSSIRVQISCINQYGNKEEFQKSIIIPMRDDGHNPSRREYSGILKGQQAKGNNGIIKTKYVTFGIEADSFKAAKLRIERVEAVYCRG